MCHLAWPNGGFRVPSGKRKSDPDLKNILIPPCLGTGRPSGPPRVKAGTGHPVRIQLTTATPMLHGMNFRLRSNLDGSSQSFSVRVPVGRGAPLLSANRSEQVVSCGHPQCSALPHEFIYWVLCCYDTDPNSYEQRKQNCHLCHRFVMNFFYNLR